MKKTISINIAGTIFYIEDDAYVKLDEYLKSIKTHFSSYPDHEEIVSDIEARVAEQFLAGKEQSRDKIVTVNEVEQLIKTMGEVKDFKADDNAETKSEPTQPIQKRLYRNPDDVVIAGVASGLGSYFGIDPIIFRLLFVILTLGGGSGILFYILLWIFIPEASTPAEKLQMKGERIKLADLEHDLNRLVNTAKADGPTIISKVGNGIGSLIRLVVKYFSRIIAFFVGIGVTMGIFAATFAYAVALFNRNSPYVDFPLGQVVSGGHYYFIITAIFITAIIPLIMIMLAAVSILRSKNIFKYGTVFALIGLWFIILIADGVYAIKYGPEYEAKYNNLPIHQEVSKTFNNVDFTKLQVGSAVTLNLTKGEQYSITATGRQIDMDKLHIEQENNKLEIFQRSESKICFFCFGSGHGGVTINMTVPNLDEIRASGAARITSDKLNPEELKAMLSGAARMDLKNLSTFRTVIVLSGASNATIAGSSNSLSLESSGASKFNGENFIVKTSNIDISGASQVRVNASETLSGEASGASKIYYFSKPDIDIDLSGASKVINGMTGSTDYRIEFPNEPGEIPDIHR